MGKGHAELTICRHFPASPGLQVRPTELKGKCLPWESRCGAQVLPNLCWVCISFKESSSGILKNTGPKASQPAPGQRLTHTDQSPV